MPMKYKINVLDALKEAGYKNKEVHTLFGETACIKFKTGAVVSTILLARLCLLLDKQPEDIIEYEKTDSDIQEIKDKIATVGGIYPPAALATQKKPRKKKSE